MTFPLAASTVIANLDPVRINQSIMRSFRERLSALAASGLVVWAFDLDGVVATVMCGEAIKRH